MSGFTALSIGVLVLTICGTFIYDFMLTTEYCYASILTLSDSQPRADCFRVSKKGTFKNVYIRKKPRGHIDGYVLPGLWDGHGHVLQYGESLNSVDLFQSKSLADIRRRTVKYLEDNPGEGSAKSWLRGIGWDQAAFDGVMPTAADLESNPTLKGKYIMLDRIDVHCVWVSQAVIDLLPKPLPDHVDGGEIVRDPGLGVFCDNAMDIIQKVFPTPPKEKKAKWLKDAMVSLNSMGIVGVHDAGVVAKDLDLYEEKAKHDDWTVRIYAMFECATRNTVCPEQARKIETKDDRLSVRSVKLFADGALGSWGSAMQKPYTDRPDDTGSLLVNSETLKSLAKSWASAGYQVNIHAIGDLANQYAVDALEAGLEQVCAASVSNLTACQDIHRFRIEHAQIVAPKEQERMAAIGIIPSIQPTHATSDMAYAEDRLGSERLEKEAYRMASFSPLLPILGSDFPVEPANPFEGIYSAVTRKSPRTGLGKDGSKEGWNVGETLTIRAALRGFTRHPARGAFMEKKAGIIAEGAWADWIVLDQDILRMDIEMLRKVKVRETWIAGKRVYKRD